MKTMKLLFTVMIMLVIIKSNAQDPGPFSTPYPPVVYIISSQDQMLIDLPAGSKENNKEIKPYEFNGGPNQLWCIYKEKTGYVFLSPFSKKVLAVDIHDSTLVQQNFDSKKIQYWEIEDRKGVVQIYNKATNLYITNVNKGIPLQLKTRSGDNNQQWHIIEPWDMRIKQILKK